MGGKPVTKPRGDFAGADVSIRRVALLVDHPWPDLDIEGEIFEAAGIDLVAGPETAGTQAEVEALVRRVNPQAILTCWAPVSEDAITSSSKLQVIARLGVGLDNIAVHTASRRGAWVTNVPDYCTSEVSDHAIALMLSHYRGVSRLDRQVKESGWSPNINGLARISDLTVGIVGLGRIGRETARKLKSFGCKIIGVSHGAIDVVDVAPVSLLQMQKQADAIILHLPLTHESRHLVNRTFIDECHRRPLLINVSRGGLVDNEALLEALNDGRLRGAALDVVEGEPNPPRAILEHPSVIVTPHVAFGSDASLRELRRRACIEVVRILNGDAPINPCNKPLRETTLDGGVSSDVRIVHGASGPEVVKTALPKLKVAADWFSDPARSSVEVAAIGIFAELIGTDAVPRVLWNRPEEHAFAMELVNPRLRNWKKDLLAGHIDRRTASRAGELLGQVHSRSGRREDLRQRFGDTRFFDELRLEPFYLRTAASNSELGPLVAKVAEGMARRRTALVHGDYSPKNILADGGEVVILDFEVTHWGDPRFDVGFCISHLCLKAIHAVGTAKRALADSIEGFMDSYSKEGPTVLDEDFVQIAGCLMLARIEGASPVEYLQSADMPRVLSLAAAMIREPKQFVHRAPATWDFA
jgi:D-3-phosphoglycerate dehydrogenase